MDREQSVTPDEVDADHAEVACAPTSGVPAVIAGTLVQGTATKALLLFVAVIVSALAAPLRVAAHHSGHEYAQTTVEIDGTLVEARWENPHVHLFVRATGRDGELTTWDIECNSLSTLRRTEATPENLKVGDTIKVAGAPSRRARHRMWASNILTANGREIVLAPGARTRWTPSDAASKH